MCIDCTDTDTDTDVGDPYPIVCSNCHSEPIFICQVVAQTKTTTQLILPFQCMGRLKNNIPAPIVNNRLSDGYSPAYGYIRIEVQCVGF